MKKQSISATHTQFRYKAVIVSLAVLLVCGGCRNHWMEDILKPFFPDFNFEYDIGDTGPGGGKIFYVSPDGFTMTGIAGTCHYLEVSPGNLTGGTGSQATMRWSTATIFPYPTTDETLTTVGSGKNNTAIIIAAESAAYSGDTYIYAARACGEYTGGGKDDWFLPSKDELNELYKAKGNAGIPTTGLFWSSSPVDNYDIYAWFQYFDTGIQSNFYKYGDYNVRAVRAF